MENMCDVREERRKSLENLQETIYKVQNQFLDCVSILTEKMSYLDRVTRSIQEELNK